MAELEQRLSSLSPAKRKILLKHLKERSAAVSTVELRQEPVSGPLPLSPIQRWFFERDLPEPHHYNQAVLLEVREPLVLKRLSRALEGLLEHHDALRLRFVRPAGKAGDWRQVGALPGDPPPLTRVDLSRLDPETGRMAMAALVVEAQASLDLARGPLMRMVLAEFGPDRPGRLFWTVHHLAVDGTSWRVLLEDLEQAYRQLERGEAVRLPARTTSFKEWAERLEVYAGSPTLAAEREYWTAVGHAQPRRLPVDFPDGVNSASSTTTVESVLPAEETWNLLREVPSAYRNRIDEVLLAALALVLGRWTGRPEVLVSLEGHGREELFEGVDLARTVGWFTSLFPVLLKPEAEDPGRALKSIKEQLRAVPRGGLGYGVLRYLNREHAAGDELRCPEPEVLFNYLGQMDTVFSPGSLLRPAPEPYGPLHGSGGLRSHLLELNGHVFAGCLRLEWEYSRNLHRHETIARLAGDFLETLRALIRHCLSPQAGGYTPSDFPLAGLEQTELNALLGSGRGIEEVYPLSPLQQGMLFHSLLQPGAGEYFDQVGVTFTGALNVSALRRAWQRLGRQHSTLRTAFFWEGLREPLQVVYRELTLPWEEEDWRGLSEQQLRDRLASELEADVRRGFELNRAPLMRLRLIRTGESRYRFVWSSHHLLLDGWSVALVFAELAALYRAFSQGRDLVLKQRRPYRDYIAWLRGRDPAAAAAFWRRALGANVTPTLLAVARGRQHAASELADYRFDSYRLPAPELEALQAVAAKHQLTLNTLFEGAWSLLLARYTGADEVVFGTTVSGRSAAPEWVESMVGVFINTLPVRIRVAPAGALPSWLSELQASRNQLLEYEDTPLERIREWIEVPAESPLFDHILVFENYPTTTMLRDFSDEVEISDLQAFERANYPLALIVLPGAGIELRFAYDRQDFDAAAVRRLAGHLRNLLRALGSRSDCRPAELPMLSPAERHQVLVDWNDTAVVEPSGALFPELVERWAKRTPEAVAVVCEDQRLSYRELDRRANQLAHYLRARGVAAETLVGLAVERSPELVVGILAILKAGGAWLPLDPTYPRERLALMIADSRLSVVLTQERLRSTLPDDGAQVICLDSAWPAVAAEPTASQAAGVRADNAAYVIYTSGSTGRPKGAVIAHRGLRNLAAAQIRLLGLRSEDRILQFSSLNFDASVWEIAMALSVGASLHLAYPDRLLPGPPLLETLRERRITTATLPPTALAVLGTADQLPALRTLIVAGEACPLALARQWSAGRHFFNAYGPTETTVCATAGRYLGDPRLAIGTPIANTRIRILDRRLRPVAVGLPGEILIGGASVDRGYLKRPALTAERFIPDPFSTDSCGDRLYRTGDLGRYLADGTIDFLGRIDYQVKLRGFRIELGEIEAVLCRHPAVREAVVLVHEEPWGTAQLLAWLVPEAAPEPTVDELRAFLRDTLPDYMVPAAWGWLEALPVTPNGKVDRSALARRALPGPGREPAGECLAAGPGDPTEDLLAGIWAAVLAPAASTSRRVRADDNFFDLGGHSLLATQITSRVRDVFQVELPMLRLFEAPTLGEMAEVVRTLRREGQGVARTPIARTSGDRELPLSFAQLRLWLLDRLEPGGAAYNVPMAVRLVGRLDTAMLAASLSEIVRRHEALRTTFEAPSGEAIAEPVQHIGPPRSVPLPVVDLRGLPEPARTRESRRRIGEHVGRPFDLARGPLLRALLVRSDREEAVLAATIHHIVSDGWSMGVLIRELGTLYEAFCERCPSPLPELAVRYADFAAWQRQWIRGEALDRELSWWRQQLEGVPQVLDLPTDRPRPPIQSYRGATLPVALPPALSRELEEISRRRGATVFMTLLAAFQLLLSRVTSQQDLLVGSPIAGRNHAQLEDLIGVFVNTLVLRADLRGHPTFSELLGRVRETTLDAYAHQDLPFEKLVDELQPERDLSRSPLFQVLFVLQNAPAQQLELPHLSLSFPEHSTRTAKFDLSLSLTAPASGLRGGLEYATDLFDATTMRRLWHRYALLLAEVVADPERSPSELSLLSAAEKQQLLVEWNATAGGDPHLPGLVDRFEARVATKPEAIALVWEDAQLSYRELNRRINRLAHHLRSRGVGPEGRVAVLMKRSPELVVALMAVLKAGAAYVPIDPAYPPQRRALVLQDSGAELFLERLVEEDLAGQPEHDPRCRIHPQNLSWIIYTSGSTGRPKGVAICHGAAAALCRFSEDRFPDRDLAGVLASTSVCFDLSVFEILVTLARGGTVILAQNALDLPRLPAAQRVTLVNTVPSAMTDLVRRRGLPPGVRTVNLAGEALPRSLVEAIYAHTAVERVFNLYGPSEDTTYSTWALIGRETGIPAIGRPVTETRIQILDRDGNPVPPGTIGELAIAGCGLARGYLDRPALSAQRFVPDPFGESGERRYLTGDLARYRSDGNLEYLGRIDHQVKIRGFRIELGEIEAGLSQFPGLRQVAVLGLDDQRLAAWLACAQARPAPAELREFLRRSLPEYMIPSFFLILDQLPLTPSGKIDRRALAQRGIAGAEGESDFMAPRTPLEEQLAEIWAQLLKVEKIGVRDNFFHVGGHSLLVTQLLSKIKYQFHVDLPLTSFFTAPTIEQLARTIEVTRWAGSDSATGDDRAAADTTAAEELEEFEI